MKILVPISKVPDTTSNIVFSEKKVALEESNMSFIVNPYDEWYALTKSLILKETLSEPVEIVLLCVGDANVEPLIRKALSIGGDRAIRVNAESHDSKFIAFQISEIAKAEKYNLIIGGKETISYNGGLVLSMVAEFMEAPFFNEITKLEFKDTAWIGQVNAEGGYQVLKAKPNTPVIASCAKGLAEQRFASLKGILSSKSKAIEVKEPAPFTEVVSTLSYELMPQKKSCIYAKTPEELFDFLKNNIKTI